MKRLYFLAWLFIFIASTNAKTSFGKIGTDRTKNVTGNGMYRSNPNLFKCPWEANWQDDEGILGYKESGKGKAMGLWQFGFPQTFYANEGRDGIGNDDDCDDLEATPNPGTIWYLDEDGDGYYTGEVITQCTSPGALRFLGIKPGIGYCVF